jgi:acyl-CoA synthetase (NDP forming)
VAVHELDYVFHPRSIAVVGASGNPEAGGRNFTSSLLAQGFKGKLYLVNPKYSEIMGLKAYASLRDVPGTVDYVISCVPASQVLNIMADFPEKKVRAMHMYTARFSETGRREDAELEQEILKEAKKQGVRLIGPNCVGLYYPREGISFGEDLPKESGPVGLVSQTGGGASNLIQLAAFRGVRFSKVISYGNALDSNECDFLDYLSHDEETKIVLMYIEGLRDARRFFTTLRQTTPRKPVIIIKGGMSESSARAAVSHTASLAGSAQTWQTAVAQTGAIPAKSLDGLADLAASFSFLPPIAGNKVAVVGGGGGASVLAADQCEEAGLDVIPLPAGVRESLREKGVATWDWISNPADVSVWGWSGADLDVGDSLKAMAESPEFDFLIVHIREPHRKSQKRISADEYLQQYRLDELNDKPVLAVVADKSTGIADYGDWRWKLMAGVRTRLSQMGIPFYPTVERAARSARELISYHQWRTGLNE